ncbi:MAG: sodium:alanine symporter family protein [Peptoniphilaceae bacterium]|nr:sodium:alanine symporter family protein [Peptoniphilaceae bacterium]MDD7383182.1 sodium:alanine symporter family protein [Peptoniphilaceae bacterium]MDY3738406.1 sodium:alanine symporter family protein [Peptoniphilaceae bacterium]
MLDKFLPIIELINSVLRNYILVVALVGTGIFLTFYLGGVQFRKISVAFKQAFSGIFSEGGGISSFKALSVAVAAQVGTGNIVGVATAIMSGGPGAIFWMWVSAIFGEATIFAEALLAQRYKVKVNGEYIGGPVYYLKNGVKKEFIAKIFAVLAVIAFGFFGSVTQSNSIASSLSGAIPKIPPIVFGILVGILAAFVIIGGINRIANFARLAVPFMAIIYIVFSIIVMIKFRAYLIPSLKLIFTSAFDVHAIAGGAAGYGIKKAISMGVSRGLFSNEAGMGSTPHAHATAEVDHPAQQGLVAMCGTVIDTLVICTMTAMVILTTESNSMGLSGALITQNAFKMAFGNIGVFVLALSLMFFAFTTIIGWYYFGEINYKYLFKGKAISIYRILVIAFIVLGSVQKIDAVWEMSDMMSALIALPNIYALLYLRKEIKEVYNDFLSKEDELYKK